MNNYRIVGISQELAAKARTTLASPQYGHPASASIATGYGPCRLCLQTFVEGVDKRVLFTYNPFEGLSDYPSPGPIFVHQHACQRFEDTVFPPMLRDLPLMLEGYGAKRWLFAREQPNPGTIEAAIERLLALPEVEYIHIRNAEAGCFIGLIERQP